MAFSSAATPMMAQFLEIKAQYPDALLFYRMGDFYEMFFDDAVAAAAALDIALTKRGKHEGKDIAMCGVPQHAAEGYLLTLIRKGFRVAVCDQMESPAEAKKRGYKAVVKREVVRLVTPGTLTEDTLLDARRHNYLAAYAQVRDAGAYAWLDLSTGELHVARCPLVTLGPMLARTGPREVLVVEGEVPPALDEDPAVVTPLGRASFDSEAARTRLETLYGTGSLDGFGQFDRAELAALNVRSSTKACTASSLPRMASRSVEGAHNRVSSKRAPAPVTVRSMAVSRLPSRPPLSACVSSRLRRVAASICIAAP